MDFKLEKKAMKISRKVASISQAQAIDLEMNLPDYCSDIKSILKCFLIPNINSVAISEQKISAQGTALIRIVYVNDEEKLDSYEQSVEISKSASVKDLPSTAICVVGCSNEYVNCRAASQRRANVSASILLTFNVYDSQSFQVPCSATGSGIQVKNEKVQMQNLITQNEKIFDLSETVALKDGKLPIGKIIRSDAWATIDSQKAVSNKLLIKGELFVEILYCSDNSEGSFEKILHTMPISQIVELSDIDETSSCDVDLNVRSLALATKTDSSGESKLIEIACKVSAFVKASQKSELNVISDSYCTKYNINADYSKLEFEQDVYNDFIDKNVKSTIELSGQQIKEVVDVWCCAQNNTVSVKDSLLTGTSNLTLGVIFKDQDDKIHYSEKPLDFDYDLSLNQEFEKVDCKSYVKLEKLEFLKVGSDRIEIKLQAKIKMHVFASELKRVCMGIDIDEADVKAQDTTALTVYFTTKGENVWDIARRYNTTVDAINCENGLSSDVIEQDVMLIIPCA